MNAQNHDTIQRATKINRRKGKWWMKKREFVRHKGIEQKGKTKTINLLLHNFFGI
jgi:hypothetical protein